MSVAGFVQTALVVVAAAVLAVVVHRGLRTPRRRQRTSPDAPDATIADAMDVGPANVGPGAPPARVVVQYVPVPVPVTGRWDDDPTFGFDRSHAAALLRGRHPRRGGQRTSTRRGWRFSGQGADRNRPPYEAVSRTGANFGIEIPPDARRA
jgi:hypothetical protein